ncbi:MAG: RcnB family protein [Sphingobium sp.]
MRNIVLTALMAASALSAAVVPATASAQSRGEVRESYRDLQEERRDLRRAYRNGDRRDIREERRDVARAEREYSKDLRDYRRSHRNAYKRGKWNAPFRYHQWDRGAHMGRTYYSSRYYLNDPWRYRLPKTHRYERWVRHYDDVLLVDVRNGRVITAYHNFFF